MEVTPTWSSGRSGVMSAFDLQRSCLCEEIRGFLRLSSFYMADKKYGPRLASLDNCWHLLVLRSEEG